MGQEGKNKTIYSEIKYVKIVTIGGINPNSPLSDKTIDDQNKLLNECLNGYPKGIIIGKDIAIGRYMLGDHELIMQKTNYHIGFTRKPSLIF